MSYHTYLLTDLLRHRAYYTNAITLLALDHRIYMQAPKVIMLKIETLELEPVGTRNQKNGQLGHAGQKTITPS
jgi:hypothetical protein